VEPTDPALRMLATLLDEAHLASPDQIADAVMAAAAAIGASARTYLIDYPQQFLVPLPVTSGSVTTDRLAVDGTSAGRAFRQVQPIAGESADGQPRLWVPIVDGVERLGVLDIVLPPGTTPDDDAVRERIRLFAHLVGHIIGSKSPYGDSFHRARLPQPRTVASELIWSLLPPLTVASRGLVISGLLEPSHAVAGDVFDYAIARDRADVAIVDATGHDIRSGVIGSLALAAYRKSRRDELSLEAAVDMIDHTLSTFEPDTYATGVFGQLDIATGSFRHVNAGHPSPLLLRDGKVVKELDGGRRPLLGLAGGPATTVQERLEPGDWLILYTDGIPEARDEARDFFGMRRFVDSIERCAAARLTPPETSRQIMRTILEHQHGRLQDDATLLIIQWATGHEERLAAE
jgi:phosphoserine phosphatase RsbU/P